MAGYGWGTRMSVDVTGSRGQRTDALPFLIKAPRSPPNPREPEKGETPYEYFPP